eukprot:9487269-Ditylum_brightwellii.AAC.2
MTQTLQKQALNIYSNQQRAYNGAQPNSDFEGIGAADHFRFNKKAAVNKSGASRGNMPDYVIEDAVESGFVKI